MKAPDHPVKRMMLVRKIGGKFVVGVQGTAQAPIKRKLVSFPAPKTQAIFPVCSVEMDSPRPSSL